MIADGNFVSFPLAICIKKSAKRSMHTVQCLTDFFIKVFADLKDQASLQSYDLAPHPPPSFPLYQSVIRPPSPLKNPRKFKEKQHKNCPRSEVEKSYSRPSDSTVPTDAGNEPRTVATGALAVRRPNH